MIDIRYHLAAIVGIFFALGLGMLMGAQLADDGTIVKEYERLIGQIEASVERVRADNRRLGEQLLALEGRLDAERAFADEALAYLVAGRLGGVPVDIVASPEAASYSDRVLRGLERAGADVNVRDDTAASPGRKHALQLYLWGEVDEPSMGPPDVAEKPGVGTDSGAPAQVAATIDDDLGNGTGVGSPLDPPAGERATDAVWGWPAAAAERSAPTVSRVRSIFAVDTAQGMLTLIDTLRGQAGLTAAEAAGGRQ